MSQQTADATISGASRRNSCANAASTAADNIHNWARLIIIKITSRACQTAVRPRGCDGFPAPRVVSTFIATYLSAGGKNLAVVHLELYDVQRTGRRPVENLAGIGAETTLVTWTFKTVVSF